MACVPVTGAEGALGTSLPALNATLNGTAALLLCVGLYLAKRRRLAAHGRVMIAAFGVSAAFLVSYLYYHFAVVSEVGYTRFRGAGLARTAYYALLLSHTLLAVVNLPMILVTLLYAYRRAWERHRRIARITWPVWFYVSVTGVFVYVVLYHLNPPAA
jgi:uncharacterized membrane protein YozB (DUF420 family)